jgi:1-acyl-sn-glycerol-3-phosphate acyltransferase
LATSTQPPTPAPPPPLGAAGIFRAVHRAPRVLFYIIACLVNLALLALRRPPVTKKAECLHRWSARALRSAGIHAHIKGPRPSSGVIVCNHTSYVDILLMAAAVPTLFVSKKEVRAYPIIGQAAELCGTIFIDRDKSFSGQNIASEMDEALIAGACITFFPEGTTTDGSTMLRFRAALFSAPLRLRKLVTPAAIRYTLPDQQHGDPAHLVCYWGDMVLLPHVIRLLALPRADAYLIFADEAFSPAELYPAAGAGARSAANHSRELVQQLREELGAPPLPAGEPLTSFPPQRR